MREQWNGAQADSLPLRLRAGSKKVLYPAFSSFLFWLAFLLGPGVGCLPAAEARNQAGQVRILDVMRVRADQPASSAVLTLRLPSEPTEMSCDVLIVGAGTGGVAAALAAAEGGHTVCLTEETHWIGGQMTAQGVSAFDGNAYIETTGATASFQRLRYAIRDFYGRHFQLSSSGAGEKFFNPGDCWVSALCFEAPVALTVLDSMLQPYQRAGLLRIFLRTKAVNVERQGNRIVSVLTYGFEENRWVKFRPRYVLDATDLGELLPLAGVEYSPGAEPPSLTGEPDARQGDGDASDNQSFTYTFVVARDPGRDHRIAKPAEYEAHRQDQPYTLKIDYGEGKFLTYKMFERAPRTPGSFWTYRRLIAAENFLGPGAPRETSMINWPGNDYCGSGLLSNDPDEQAQALREAKLTALGLVYWLQNEVPRDDGRGTGYPDLEMVTSALGSADGLSQFPYIRESRRLRAIATIKEQDISSLYQKGSRAALFSDSVGIALYPIDIHSCSKQDFTSPTKPFQIPLGALVPQHIENLLAASKNIGSTHITNGAYRLHPGEWAIGEAAGTLADFVIDRNATPRKIAEGLRLMEDLQVRLLDRGVPIYWFDDLRPGDPGFREAQLLATHGVFGSAPGNLHFGPRDPVKVGEAMIALERALKPDFRVQSAEATATAEEKEVADAVNALVKQGYASPDTANAQIWERPLVLKDLDLACLKSGLSPAQHPEQSRGLTRAEFAMWLARLYQRRLGLSVPAGLSPRDAP